MKHIFSKSLNWLGEHWRGLASAVIITLLACLTLGLGINSLVPGQNKFETATLAQLETFPKPWNSPIDAPYLVPAYLIGQVIDNPLLGARITSVIYGLIAVILLFYVLKLWFNIRIATVGSLLFITSSWLLTLSHMGAPLILLAVMPVLCIAPLAWFLRTKKYKALAFVLFALALGLAAYVPYMIWLSAITLATIIIKDREHLMRLKTWQIILGAGLYLVLLVPLFANIVSGPEVVLRLLGIPEVLTSFSGYFTNLGALILGLFVYSGAQPELILGNLPLLDIFSTAMFILGVFYLVKLGKNRRTIILFSSLITLILLLPLRDDFKVYQSILLSLVYIVIISGIVELLNRWFGHFPRNPWARNFGVVLVVVVIGFASFYHLQRYYIAWPNAPETKQVYVVK